MFITGSQPAHDFIIATCLDEFSCPDIEQAAPAWERGLGLHAIAVRYRKPTPSPGLMFGNARLTPPALRAAMRAFGECLDAMETSQMPPWCAAARFAVS